jgi:uncharacterized membrane protein
MNVSSNYLSQHFIGVVFFLQAIMYVSLFLNLPVAKEVIGIFYLTFIPGLIFIKLLKLKFNELELIVFSAGFSIAFLMISGLLLSQFGPLVGLSFPLSALPLSLVINTVIIAGTVVAYLRQDRHQPQNAKKLSFNPAILLLALIPVLSIIGTNFSNTTGSSLVLLSMIFSIALLFVFLAFNERFTKVYPFAIVMIALALLLQVALTSNYIVPYGGDSPAEFYVFRITQINSQWNPIFQFPVDQGFGRFNSMLSITILPTVYSNMLGMDPTWVFKIIYPLLFALVPLALYLLWQSFIGKKFAFLAAFLFMAQSTFFTEMTALNRQMVGELFFVLLIFTLLNQKLKMKSKFLIFGVLSFGLIISHYALAEIFFVLIFASWAISFFYLKRPSMNLQLGNVLFFFVAMFGWYIYTSGSVVYDSFLTFTGYITGQLGDFFNPASRGQTVLTGLGLTQSPSFINTVSRGFAYVTELFIIIGIIVLLLRRMHFKFDKDYTIFSLIAVFLLVALTVVPGLANTLNMTRFYHILLIFLAPFCIIGIWAFAKLIFRSDKKLVVSLLVVLVLVPYFLFQTNAVYEVAQADSWSIPLSKFRMEPLRLYGDYGYIDTYSVHGAQWVSNNVPYPYNIAADNGLYTSLTAYGLVYRGYVTELRNTTILRSGEFVYLSYITVKYDSLLSNGSVPTMLNQTDLVYSNSGSDIYYTP